MFRRDLFSATTSLAAASILPGLGRANTAPVKIGIITDMSSLYADFSGQGSVEAAKMAAEDYIARNPGASVEVVSADHQNRPDVATTIARRWFDTEGVDVIADVTASSAALAVAGVAREKNKVFLATNAGSNELTGRQCSPNTVHWTYDAWGFAQIAKPLVERGDDTWFFLTADYAYGYAVEAATSEVVRAAGGRVVGSVRHPLNTTDMSSFLLQAQASRAKIIALANAGGDTINSIRQAGEFGLTRRGQKLAGLAIFITDVNALGLQAAQGLQLMTWFYWDLNDNTRAFSRRFAARRGGRVPSMGQAGNYSALALYLDTVKQVGSAQDGRRVVAAMRERGEYDDPLFGRTHVRTDGRAVHPMYLAEVKRPEESRAPWDYYKIVTTIPPEAAAQPLAASRAAGCALVP